MYYEELTAETFHDRISTDTAVFVMYYSPDCPHCKAWSHVWYEMAAMLQDDEDVLIAKVRYYKILIR